jgi:hypothetical protein
MPHAYDYAYAYAYGRIAANKFAGMIRPYFLIPMDQLRRMNSPA